MRYFGPSFSSSARTQSVMQGMPVHIYYIITWKRGERGEGEREGEGRTFSIETVHHAAHELELVLQTEVDEVGVDEDAVGRDERGVVCEEKGGRDRVTVPPQKNRSDGKRRGDVGGGRREREVHFANGFFFGFGFFFGLFRLVFFPDTEKPRDIRRKGLIVVRGGTYRRMSFGFSIRFTCANLRVFLALP